MMFFKRKRSAENKVPAQVGVKDKTARRLAAAISYVQNGFAGIMDKWVNQLNKRGKKIFAIIFCLVFGCYSLYILSSIFTRNRNQTNKAITPEAVSIPKHFDKAGDESTISTVVVSETDFKKIQLFNLYMDSLQRSQSGRNIHDSIVCARPGLLDSVKMLKQLYHSQKQNK